MMAVLAPIGPHLALALRCAHTICWPLAAKLLSLPVQQLPAMFLTDRGGVYAGERRAGRVDAGRHEGPGRPSHLLRMLCHLLPPMRPHHTPPRLLQGREEGGAGISPAPTMVRRVGA